MTTEQIIEERVSFDSNGVRLTGVMSYPQQQSPAKVILLCSPHPHFAGNMDNNVISELARYFASDSVTFRFDYHGVGDSQANLDKGESVFDYWDKIEKDRNYQPAIDDIAAAMNIVRQSIDALDLPVIVIGYSFGVATGFIFGSDNNKAQMMIGIAPPLGKVDFSFLSDCASPALLLIGKNDFLYSTDKVNELKSIVNESVTIETIEGSDHFFRGEEKIICDRISNYIRDNKKDQSCS